MLRTQVAVAAEDGGALLHILPHTVVESGGMEERIHVKELGAGSDMEVAAVRREIGLRLVGPERVEALGDVVLLDDVPVPLRRVGVRRVDI